MVAELFKMIWNSKEEGGSRKAKILTAGAITTLFANLLPFIVIITGWDPAHQALWTQLGQHLETLALTFSTIWAGLIALEDTARKLFVTAPPPGEIPPVAPNRPVS